MRQNQQNQPFWRLSMGSRARNPNADFLIIGRLTGFGLGQSGAVEYPERSDR
jgi:hypothetical protein